MIPKIAIQASYSDFKLIKSRSVAQIVLEVDIDRAEDFLTAFGLPLPGKERPVALALLKGGDAKSTGPIQVSREPEEGPSNVAPVAEPRASSGGASLTPGERAVRMAGILCSDQQFQEWLWRETNGSETPDPWGPSQWESWATTLVRHRCNIISRKQLKDDDMARARWHAIETAFRQATGQMAVDYRSGT